MIPLELIQPEEAALLLNMKIARKNVKKGFKSNYGSKRGKEILSDYDKVIELLENELDSSKQEGAISLEISEFNVLHSFVTWYVSEFESLYAKAGKELTGEDKEQINTLKSVNEKLKKKALAYA